MTCKDCRDKDARILELREALDGLLTFNEELCQDVGVATNYPSAYRARRLLSKPERRIK